MPIPLPVIMGGIQAVGSLLGNASEKRRKENALNRLKKLKYPELNNVTDGLTIAREAGDAQLREVGRAAATGIDALQASGTRGVVGGTGRIIDAVTRSSEQIVGDFERQRAEINNIAANDELRKRLMREQRLDAEIDSLSNEVAAGQQGQGNMLNSLLGGLGMMGYGLYEELVTPTQSPVGVVATASVKTSFDKPIAGEMATKVRG